MSTSTYQFIPNQIFVDNSRVLIKVGAPGGPGGNYVAINICRCTLVGCVTKWFSGVLRPDDYTKIYKFDHKYAVCVYEDDSRYFVCDGPGTVMQKLSKSFEKATTDDVALIMRLKEDWNNGDDPKLRYHLDCRTELYNHVKSICSATVNCKFCRFIIHKK